MPFPNAPDSFLQKKKRQTGCAAQADRIKPAKTLGAA